jgi:predicted transcriptional regulator
MEETMDDILKEALEIVKAQASHRIMQSDEVVVMLRSLTNSLKDFESPAPETGQQATLEIDAKKSIKEKTITCLECGKAFKVITKKHLATHDLTPESYREKFGLKKNSPLICKGLQRERRSKMKSMRLWEQRKGKNKGSQQKES